MSAPTEHGTMWAAPLDGRRVAEHYVRIWAKEPTTP